MARPSEPAHAALDSLRYADGTLLWGGQKVIDLAAEAGMRGWHAGPIANSAAAEALTSILIQINRQGEISHAGIKIVGQEVH